MLKELRIKFIALNMATVAVVLAVIFSAICVINYQQSVASVHEAMSNAIAFTESKSRALTDGDTQVQEGAREQDAGDPDEQADPAETSKPCWSRARMRVSESMEGTTTLTMPGRRSAPTLVPAVGRMPVPSAQRRA